MRTLTRLVGNLLVLASLAGLASLGVLVVAPGPDPVPDSARRTTLQAIASAPDALTSPLAPVQGAAEPAMRALGPEPAPEPAPAPLSSPITRIAIQSIGLDSVVVPSSVAEKDGGLTWGVPAFAAGHAEGTAGAGQAGNVVLLGHVTSFRSGDVFKDLHRVQPGEIIHVYSEAQGFGYRVVDVRAVPRTDASAMAGTETPSLTLITCTGVWLPTIWDYTERLVVRATLVL